ncbi:hypothetical protein PENANT_c015G08294 [Penicillium antarcticum]|uniref:Uncharacterized protein n=1 Tax=Penicillium antarcticum TaxID=416450 RepID=A0A1V6Q3Y4_9EURO|nr:uncharacterized protein N7508_004962 [Penicillium antarcticum]KAJ5305947.1 hypothetical protein N7508_004962 [Penicillium antarcticum]OQD83727.1 hypothetical protein PENANT_c015G08294 [Penicillium antarcticum]
MAPPQIPIPPLGLATARGALLLDIRVDHALPGTRGKQLTAAQEAVLWTLYLQHDPFPLETKLPGKRFWMDLAVKFQERTGRSYSWLSVKRRVVALLIARGIPVEWRSRPTRLPMLEAGSPEAAVQSGRGLSHDGFGGERSVPEFGTVCEEHSENKALDTPCLSQRATINQRLEQLQSSQVKTKSAPTPEKRTGSVREEHKDLDESQVSRRSTFSQRIVQLQSSRVKPKTTSTSNKSTKTVSDWIKKNNSTSLPDKVGNDAEPRLGSQSPCPVQFRSFSITKSRAQSRSPQFNGHPVYRTGSPDLNGRMEHRSKRLQDQLASAWTPRTESRKRKFPDIPRHDLSCRNDPHVVVQKCRSPLKSNSAHESFEDIHPLSHKNGSESPHKAMSGQPDIDSSSSDDEDNLPETPVRIVRRCREAK